MNRKIIATVIALGMVTMTFGLIMSAPGVLAAPTIAPIITDATDGIGTIYEDGGAAGAGLVGQAKAWVIGKNIAGQQFNLIEMPEETADSGANNPGTDYLTYDAGNHWALGDGWVSGDNSVWYEQLRSGLTYTHNAAIVTTIVNYSAAKYVQLDTANPQWDSAPYAVLEAIPTVTYSGTTLDWNGFVDVTTAAPCVGWNVYYSDTDLASFVLDGTAPDGPYPINYAIGAHSYYAIEPLWDNTGGNPAQIGFGLYSWTPGSTPATNEVPVVASSGTTPSTHDGNTLSEQVTIYANITDADATDMLIAQYNVSGTGWVNFPQSTVSPLNASAVYNFPDGFTEGLKTVEIRGYDSKNYSVIVNADFTITDTTAPLVTSLMPGLSIGRTDGSAVDVSFTYEDFTNYSVARLYYWHQSEPLRNNSLDMTPSNFRWGSYMWDFDGTFTATGLLGEQMFWEIDVADSAGAGANLITTARGTVNILEASDNPPAPASLYGYALQYNNVVTPLDTATVRVEYFNGTVWLWQELITDATGAYSFDFVELADGSTVYVNVTSNPTYLNLGWNYTVATADAAGEFEPIWQNVTCGIPYDVRIISPVNDAVVPLTGTFDLEYEIIDRLGVRTPGYYTFAPDGPMNVSAWPDPIDANSYVAPADQTFNGIGGGDGYYNGIAVMQINYPAGHWWLNVSEGGPTELNNYLTPWGAWYYANGTAGFLKDYHNISINATSGTFEWNLVQGWNLVSSPQAGSYRFDGNTLRSFSAGDALNWTNLVLFSQLGVYDGELAMFTRTGPGAYTPYILDTGIGFTIDSTLGYWVYKGVAGTQMISFNSDNATCFDDVNSLQRVDIINGWNLLGLQRNYSTAWNGVLYASNFTDGAVAPLLAHTTSGGAFTKLSVTRWIQATQWYDSYIVDVGFPGMAAKNWDWNEVYYSPNPGNGFWLWADQGMTIEYSTLLYHP